MNKLMATFFDSLGDGIVLVDPDGMVIYANGTGLRIFKAIPGQPFPDPRVVRTVQDVVAGVVNSPARVSLGEGVLDKSRIATVTPLPLPNTIAVSIQDHESRAFYETTLNNFHEYIGIEMSAPILRFSRMLDDYVQRIEEGTAIDPQLQKMVESGALIGTRLGRIKLMSELFRSAPLIAQERLEFATMIGDALDSEAKMLSQRKVEVYLDGFKDELPPVYGSRPWLTQAFRELISNAARHAKAESKLEISLACTGNHVVLCFRNHGQFASRHLSSRFLYVPFNQVTQLVKEKRMPVRAVVGKPVAEEQQQRGPGIGLAIVQQIVQLHGGHLRVTEGDEDEMVEFSVELATGAPAIDTAQLDIAQAQRYAKDMATLMGTVRKKKAAVAREAKPQAQEQPS